MALSRRSPARVRKLRIALGNLAEVLLHSGASSRRFRSYTCSYRGALAIQKIRGPAVPLANRDESEMKFMVAFDWAPDAAKRTEGIARFG